MPSNEVILVHGLWYGPWSMLAMARQLRSAGFAARHYAYRSTVSSPQEQYAALARMVHASTAEVVHLVGHSLGGLVILHLLAEKGEFPPGRAVLLGTPLKGSAAARKALQLPGGSVLLGRAAGSLSDGISKQNPLPAEQREIGMIAGSRAMGLGRLAGFTGSDSDGTVMLDETRSDILRQRIVLPVSHTGLLFSPEVARQVSQFLQSGQFSKSLVE